MTWEILMGLLTLLSALAGLCKTITNNTRALTEIRCTVSALNETVIRQRADLCRCAGAGQHPYYLKGYRRHAAVPNYAWLGVVFTVTQRLCHGVFCFFKPQQGGNGSPDPHAGRIRYIPHTGQLLASDNEIAS